nr:hypothetical protein [Tanacetum cinerariifolium]
MEYTTNTGIFSDAYDDEVEGVQADFNNLELTIVFSSIPTTRIHKDYPKEQIIGDPLLALQTRRMTKTFQERAMKRLNMVSIKLLEPVKTSSTPIETNKALLKDEEAEDVDVHLYRSMI